MKFQLFILLFGYFFGYYFLKIISKRLHWLRFKRTLDKNIIFVRGLFLFCIFIAFDFSFLVSEIPDREGLKNFSGKVHYYESERAKRKNVFLINEVEEKVLFSSFKIVSLDDIEQLIDSESYVEVHYYSKESLFFKSNKVVIAKSSFFDYDIYEEVKSEGELFFWIVFFVIGSFFLMTFVSKKFLKMIKVNGWKWF